MNVGRLVFEYRVSKGITVGTMARMIGVRPSQLVAMEQGHEVKADVLAKVMTWCLTEEGN